MQQAENISLTPILEPTPVVFSFDAIGWKILLVLLVLMSTYLLYKYYLYYKKNQYRRDAVTRITEIQINSNCSIIEVVKQTMFQIKLTALKTFGRNKVASLEGEKWIHFLNESGKNTNFYVYQEEILNAIYKNELKENNNFNKEDFLKTSIKWIKNHA